MRLEKLKKYFGAIILLMMLVSFKGAGTSLQEQHIEVVIRMIGDEFLLQIGDSISRVMPIKYDNGRYVIQFENEISFEPEVLSIAAFEVVKKTNMNSSFILETEKCSTHEVVHSFEISSKQDSSIIPCKSRPLPKDCYTVYFTLLDDGIKFVPVTTQENKASTDFVFVYLIAFGLIVLGLIVYWLKRKKAIVSHPSWIQIGEYHFDKSGMKLMYKDKSEELSSKEASLLELLFSNVNETVKREEILQIVWDDEGDYLGRTLDVFISKLRKKLEDDPNLKIVNIRGVGYRMVLN
ncbi:MAG: winged helix-turn-helix domain-containing protein [Flavobacteriales bacterium]